jgi:hypothetical protein
LCNTTKKLQSEEGLGMEGHFRYLHSSELIDEATCINCKEIDGTRYLTVKKALIDYPEAGGYRKCVSSEGCRGTLIAVYDEASSY